MGRIQKPQVTTKSDYEDLDDIDDDFDLEDEEPRRQASSKSKQSNSTSAQKTKKRAAQDEDYDEDDEDDYVDSDGKGSLIKNIILIIIVAIIFFCGYIGYKKFFSGPSAQQKAKIEQQQKAKEQSEKLQQAKEVKTNGGNGSASVTAQAPGSDVKSTQAAQSGIQDLTNADGQAAKVNPVNTQQVKLETGTITSLEGKAYKGNINLVPGKWRTAAVNYQKDIYETSQGVLQCVLQVTSPVSYSFTVPFEYWSRLPEQGIVEVNEEVSTLPAKVDPTSGKTLVKQQSFITCMRVIPNAQQALANPQYNQQLQNLNNGSQN